jgi:hypothetical protein
MGICIFHQGEVTVVRRGNKPAVVSGRYLFIAGGVFLQRSAKHQRASPGMIVSYHASPELFSSSTEKQSS